MSARDELSALCLSFLKQPTSGGNSWTLTPDALADAILAAGYVKPRVITTLEDLDALPIGAVCLDSEEQMIRIVRKEPYSMSYSPVPENFWDMGGGMLHRDDMVDLPLTVLWEPTP